MRSETLNLKKKSSLLFLFVTLRKQLQICLVATKYDCVKRVAKKLNFKEVGEDEDWCLYWTDLSVSIERVNQMKRWQVGLLSSLIVRFEILYSTSINVFLSEENQSFSWHE
jgi:hypothetical protein